MEVCLFVGLALESFIVSQRFSCRTLSVRRPGIIAQFSFSFLGPTASDNLLRWLSFG